MVRSIWNRRTRGWGLLQFNLLLLGGEWREGILFYDSEDSCYVLYCHATASGLHLANWKQRCLQTTDFFYSYAQSTKLARMLQSSAFEISGDWSARRLSTHYVYV